MNYIHTQLDGQEIQVPPGKVVCVGLNYSLHIAEMNNAQTHEPVLFIKPSTSLQSYAHKIRLPSELGVCHYETELTILITSKINAKNVCEINESDFYYGVGLDLTLRNKQSELKKSGLPWEKAKAFDNSCILSSWLPPKSLSEIQKSTISLKINNTIKQKENASKMLTNIKKIIIESSRYFTLMPGDVIMTGTPHGVGPLRSGENLVMSIDDHDFEIKVI